MIEPRAPLESEVNSLIGFLDNNLRPGQTWSIAAEYPQVFNSTNRNNIRIISDNDRVLAHAAIKYLLIKNTFGIFKVAAIGSVVTDPQFRNQGLSQKIIESCIAAAEQEGADFAILWSDLFDFYRKMGFELAGTEFSVVIDALPPNMSQPKDVKFIQSNKISPDSILRLYSQHTCSSMRTAEDIRKNLQIPNSHVYTAWGTNNELLAYAIEGKGADLKGYVHEWGGGVQHLLPLLAHVRREYGSPITLIASPQAQNLLRHLQNWDTMINEGFLGMIRPINLQNLFFKIQRHARVLGIKDFILEANNAGGYLIGTKNDVATLPTLADLTRLLFGPLDSKQLKPEFQKLLPVPMWIWGWDSI